MNDRSTCNGYVTVVVGCAITNTDFDGFATDCGVEH